MGGWSEKRAPVHALVMECYKGSSACPSLPLAALAAPPNLPALPTPPRPPRCPLVLECFKGPLVLESPFLPFPLPPPFPLPSGVF